MKKKDETYTGLKQALAYCPKMSGTLNILDVGCLHAVYNQQLRETFATAQLKTRNWIGKKNRVATRVAKRTVHIVACDLPSLKQIKTGSGIVKHWNATDKHTEVLILKHHTHVRNIHRKTAKKHLQKKKSYDIIFSIRPDDKHQQQWLETLVLAWKHHKKTSGVMLLYMAAIRGKTAQQNHFIEKLKKKCDAIIVKKINARIPLSPANIIILTER